MFSCFINAVYLFCMFSSILSYPGCLQLNLKPGHYSTDDTRRLSCPASYQQHWGSVSLVKGVNPPFPSGQWDPVLVGIRCDAAPVEFHGEWPRKSMMISVTTTSHRRGDLSGWRSLTMSQMKCGAPSAQVLSCAHIRGKKKKKKKAKSYNPAVPQSVNTKKGELPCLNLFLKRFWKLNLFRRFEG